MSEPARTATSSNRSSTTSAPSRPRPTTPARTSSTAASARAAEGAKGAKPAARPASTAPATRDGVSTAARQEAAEKGTGSSQVVSGLQNNFGGTTAKAATRAGSPVDSGPAKNSNASAQPAAHPAASATAQRATSDAKPTPRPEEAIAAFKDRAFELRNQQTGLRPEMGHLRDGIKQGEADLAELDKQKAKAGGNQERLEELSQQRLTKETALAKQRKELTDLEVRHQKLEVERQKSLWGAQSEQDKIDDLSREILDPNDPAQLKEMYRRTAVAWQNKDMKALNALRPAGTPLPPTDDKEVQAAQKGLEAAQQSQARAAEEVKRLKDNGERDRKIERALERIGDNNKPTFKPEDFTREEAFKTLEEQRKHRQDLADGKKLSETDGDALPFATVYRRITEDLLKASGDLDKDGKPVPEDKRQTNMSDEERKVLYGIINGFHKYYDPAHAKSVNDMDKHWKYASDPDFDGTPGVTDESAGLMHSLRAHVVSDLDRALVQTFQAGTKYGFMKEGEIGTKWRDFFDTKILNVFEKAQSEHGPEVYGTTGNSFPRWLASFTPMVKNRENQAAEFVKTWRSEAFDRAAHFFQTGDVDKFVGDHNRELRTTWKKIENFLDF